MKLIVTHISPDLDAIASSWLIKRYLPGWESADHAFVPAGKTFEDKPVDANPDIIHVDTGLGRFDHHQFSERSSATERVFDYLAEEGYIKEKDFEAIDQMESFVTKIDNFQEVDFPDPVDIRYNFMLHEFIYPLRGLLTSDKELVSMIMLVLDSILFTVKNSLQAKLDIQNGFVINGLMGKTLVMETGNEMAVKYALKQGFELVIRKDPKTSAVRIKTLPNPKYDLTNLYHRITKIDPKATWFLHASKNMLLNGSTKNPNSVPSSLTVNKLIDLVK